MGENIICFGEIYTDCQASHKAGLASAIPLLMYITPLALEQLPNELTGGGDSGNGVCSGSVRHIGKLGPVAQVLFCEGFKSRCKNGT